MYSHPFRYFRADSLKAAVQLLKQHGPDARLLAGGQSLIPLMKMRLARPSVLVDINSIPNLNHIERRNGELRIGALARHADVAASDAAAAIPILHDCADGIADVQVRNQGTVGGSVAEADPSGDWGAVLLTLETTVRCFGPGGERTVKLEDFLKDAYTTALGPEELVREISVKVPAKGSGGAYLAFKRCAPVYATVSAAVQLTLEGKNVCRDARIVLGCVGLTAIRATHAEFELRGAEITERKIKAAAEAARAAAQPASSPARFWSISSARSSTSPARTSAATPPTAAPALFFSTAAPSSPARSSPPWPTAAKSPPSKASPRMARPIRFRKRSPLATASSAAIARPA